MSKKDYELIARVLRERESHSPRSHWPSVMRERAETINALADALHAENPRMDRARFVAACNGQDSTDSAGRKVVYSRDVPAEWRDYAAQYSPEEALQRAREAGGFDVR